MRRRAWRGSPCARSLCPVFSHIQVVSSAGDSRVRAPPLLGGIIIERGTRSEAVEC